MKILKILPLNFLSSILKVATNNWGSKYCISCKKKVPFFLPYIFKLYESKLLRELKYTANDLHNYMCPQCHSHDRERHLIMFANHFNIPEKIANSTILHFAPERNIPKYIKTFSPKEYIFADLFPQNDQTIKVDMQAIPFEKEKFDLVIANHVIEHVTDDAKALAELNRVLKPGGLAILQTPFSNQLEKTFRDEGVNSDFLKTALNGQDDHLRLFGKDIFSYFSSFGFKYIGKQHLDIFTKADALKNGVNVNEPFFLFQK